MTRGDAQLLAHQIDTGHHFRHGMFDLDPRIHLNEVKTPVFIEEFERTGAAIADVDARIHTDLADFGTLLGSDAVGGGLFDHFLMAALHRTVALTQMDGMTLTVRKHLDLNVARVFKEFFHVDHVIAEGGLGLGLRGLDGIDQCRCRVHHAHATTATTTGGFDDDGITDLLGDAMSLGFVIAQGATATGHARYTGGLHGTNRFDLVAH